MKANDNLTTESVVLPLPPEATAKTEMDIYVRFMRHLRHVANSRMEIKVLTAIQFVADMTDTPDADIARMMTDAGLRAPRMAYPATYLEYADNALMRDDWEAGSASPSAERSSGALDAYR